MWKSGFYLPCISSKAAFVSASLYSLSDVHVTTIARIAALTCNECAVKSDACKQGAIMACIA